MGLYAQVAHPCRHEHELRTTSLHAARHWEVTGIATVVPNWTLRANRAPFARLMGRSNAPRVAAAHVVCRFHPAVGRIQRHRGVGQVASSTHYVGGATGSAYTSDSRSVGAASSLSLWPRTSWTRTPRPACVGPLPRTPTSGPRCPMRSSILASSAAPRCGFTKTSRPSAARRSRPGEDATHGMTLRRSRPGSPRHLALGRCTSFDGTELAPPRRPHQ